MVLKPVTFGDSALIVLLANQKQAKQNSQLFSIKSHIPFPPQFPAHYKLLFYLISKIDLPCFLPSLFMYMKQTEDENIMRTTQLLFCLLLQGWQDLNCCCNR